MMEGLLSVSPLNWGRQNKNAPCGALFCFAEREDSNPRYKFKLVQRFSKPALSATQAPLRIFLL